MPATAINVDKGSEGKARRAQKAWSSMPIARGGVEKSRVLEHRGGPEVQPKTVASSSAPLGRMSATSAQRKGATSAQ